MGKKSKNIKNTREEKQQVISIESFEQVLINLSTKQNKPLMSKKQKKKIKKQKRQVDEAQRRQNQTEKAAQTYIQDNKLTVNMEIEQNIAESLQNQSLISLSSQQDRYANQDLLNTQEKKGFQELFNELGEQNDNQIKSHLVTRKSTEGQISTLHFYHLKVDKFYKATSLNHEKLNHTHLSEPVKMRIIDGKFLNQESQVQSLGFLLNGKLIQKQIQFLKSTVFKIIAKKQNPKPSNKKQPTKKSNQSKVKLDRIKKLRENLNQMLKPVSSQQIQQMIDFLRDFDQKQDSLLVSKQKIHFAETSEPFSNIDRNMMATNNSLLIIGKKNTGKSTLAEYLKNSNSQSTCVLDCDIGRSLTVAGCVSLITSNQSINLWIGQFTPFNCIQTYVKAIKQLYHVYRQKYFSKKLIINTMGYLSGIGEMVLYEIYNIVNPSEIIVLNYESQLSRSQIDGNLSNIIHNIKTGVYLKKLLTSFTEQHSESQLKRFNQKRLSLNIQYLKNQHAQSKGIPVRFQNVLHFQNNPKHISDLIRMIKRNQFQTLKNIPIYQQDKLGSVKEISQQSRSVNMRIVLLGKQFQTLQTHILQHESKLFQIYGIGFGFEQKIYYSRKQIQIMLSPHRDLQISNEKIVAILSEGVDFQKNFYLMNQFNLIELELQFGKIPYILPLIKGIGSKGTRNNPAKSL